MLLIYYLCPIYVKMTSYFDWKCFKGYPVWKALVLHILSLKKVKNRILNDIETEQGWYGQ